MNSSRCPAKELGALAVLAVSVAVWQLVPRQVGIVAPTNSPSAAAKPPKDLAAKSSAKSIAVLPFANRSTDKENEFFTDGMHDDILTQLSRIRELHVTSRTSVEQYRGTKKTAKQIGEELGVAYILEGSVQRSGNKVRVTGQLIRAATDEHGWAKSYDKDLTATDIFALQSELAQAIAGELKAAISPQEKKLIERQPTDNIAAYDLYLKARALRDSTESSGEDQTTLLKAAVQTRPWFRLCVGNAWPNLLEPG